jgi:hypothetical protein
MRKIIPLRSAWKRGHKHPRAVKDQTPTTRQAEVEEGTVTILLKDRTAKTISSRNLEIDILDRDGDPYLIMRTRRL